MRRFLIAALLIVFPITVFAEGPVSRRDGFLMLWNGIRRPAFESREKPFVDVPEGSAGFLEITYAKYRGLIDDDDTSFYPDAHLSLQDALLWLFRTRSVDDIELLTAENLDDLLTRYPIATTVGGLAGSLSTEELQSYARDLDDLLNKEVHEVSLYGEQFHGDGTAFGETFNMHSFTAAHRTFPHNTLVRVTNVRNGKSVVVRINDRGPYVKGRDMDLSVAAFTAIEDRSKGKFNAIFQRMGDATMVGGCGGEPRYQSRVTRDVRLRPGIPHYFTLGETLALDAMEPFVIRGITYPDGTFVPMQYFVTKDEDYRITPGIEGSYKFLIGDVKNRRRTLEMMVVQCDTSPDPEPTTAL